MNRERALKIFLVSALIISLAQPSHAFLRKDYGVAKGEVVSIQKEKNQISVKDYATGGLITVTIQKDKATNFVKGQKVVVFFRKKDSLATRVTNMK